MAGFDYTYVSWDKIRPRTLAKTGLGDALKKFEAAKKTLQQTQISCVDHYVLAVEAFGAVESARTKAITACGKNPLYKAAKTALDGAVPNNQKKLLIASLGTHILNLLGTLPTQCREKKNILDQQIHMFETALTLFKTNKDVPAPLKKFVEERIGVEAAPGNLTFAELREIKDFLGKKSAFKTLLPELIEKCENVAEQIEAFPALTIRVNALAKELRPFFGIN